MDHGLYTAYLGLRARQNALDVTANNIANASTPGFKGDYMLYRSIQLSAQEQSAAPTGINPQATTQLDPSQAAAHTRSTGLVTGTALNTTAGTIRQTGRNLDVAIEGDGYFVVQTQQGLRYTRAGNFTRDPSGQLTTASGDPVMGEKGPISLPPGEAHITPDGEITVGYQSVDKFQVVRFDKPSRDLVKEGNTLLTLNDQTGITPQQVTGVRVVPGALEGANVDTVSEMAAMIHHSREFESLQKAISMLMNDVGRKVGNDIGRL